MDFEAPEQLTRKIGPLPVWGWGIAGGGVFAIIALRRRTPGNTGALPAVYEVRDAPTGGGTVGGGGGGGSSGDSGGSTPVDNTDTLDAIYKGIVALLNRSTGQPPRREPPPGTPAPPDTPSPGWGYSPPNIPSPGNAPPPSGNGSAVQAPPLSWWAKYGYNPVSQPGGDYGIAQSALTNDFNVVILDNIVPVNALEGWTVWAFVGDENKQWWQQYNPGETIPAGVPIGVQREGISLPDGRNPR